MRETGGGSVINVATIGAYKAAVINFTEVMAREWAPWGIRVNALSPGPFNSTLMQGAADGMDFAARAGAATLQKRVAECREIVGAAVCLASNASSFVTGEDHVVARMLRG